MYELKPLSTDAIPAALAKAQRYRLLNEAPEAESICLDVLACDPGNQDALVTLILAITDQFREDGLPRHVARAQELLPRLDNEYARTYYGALIYERRARAHLSASANALAYAWFVTALREFDRAVAVRPAGNDDAVLRWNACARSLNRMTAPATEPQPFDAAIMSE
jgi:hypothetical protein